MDKPVSVAAPVAIIFAGLWAMTQTQYWDLPLFGFMAIVAGFVLLLIRIARKKDGGLGQ